MKRITGKLLYEASSKDAKVPWDELTEGQRLLWDIAAKAVNKKGKDG